MKKSVSIILLVLVAAWSKAEGNPTNTFVDQDTTKEITGAGVAVSPSHVHFNVEPGKSKTQKINVTNDTKKINKFKIVFQDFDMDGKGQSAFLPAGEGQYSLSKWISVSPTFIELQPGEKKEINVTVNVPNDESGRKAAWTIMMVEQVEEKKTIDPGSGNENTIAFGITPTFAFGVFMYQNPPNVQNNLVDIIDFKLNQIETSRMLQVDIENKGDGVAYCTTYIELTNYNTGEQQKLVVKKFTIVPTLIREFNFSLPEELAKGKYSAVAVLDFGSKETINAAELEFEIP